MDLMSQTGIPEAVHAAKAVSNYFTQLYPTCTAYSKMK